MGHGVEEQGERFAATTREFLRALGSPAPALEVRDPLARTREICAVLASLYAQGMVLPEEEHGELTAAPRALFPPLRLSFPGPRAYLRHGSPDRKGSEEQGDLEEDFEDLHGELTRGLAFHDTGTENGRRLARAHWRKTFPHWGHHAIEALRALHYRIAGLPG